MNGMQSWYSHVTLWSCDSARRNLEIPVVVLTTAKLLMWSYDLKLMVVTYSVTPVLSLHVMGVPCDTVGDVPISDGCVMLV